MMSRDITAVPRKDSNLRSTAQETVADRPGRRLQSAELVVVDRTGPSCATESMGSFALLNLRLHLTAATTGTHRP
jgi:hypothetical protein